MTAVRFSFDDDLGWEALRERVAKPWLWREPADLPDCLYANRALPSSVDDLAFCGCMRCFGAMTPSLHRTAQGAIRRTLGPASYLPGIDHEDLIHEALIIASLKLPTRDQERAGFAAFVAGIAANVARRARHASRKGIDPATAGRPRVIKTARPPKAPGVMWDPMAA